MKFMESCGQLSENTGILSVTDRADVEDVVVVSTVALVLKAVFWLRSEGRHCEK